MNYDSFLDLMREARERSQPGTIIMHPDVAEAIGLEWDKNPGIACRWEEVRRHRYEVQHRRV